MAKKDLRFTLKTLQMIHRQAVLDLEDVPLMLELMISKLQEEIKNAKK